MRHLLAATAAAALVVVAGCSSSGSVSPGPQSNGADPALIAKADLAPCPPSSTTPVSGGLPNLTLNCLGKGPAVHLAGLTGKPTVVNLWGSWCGPCGEEAGYLSTVNRQYGSAVRFLGIDIEDSDDNALTFDSTRVSPPVRYPSVVDPEKKALLALHFPGPPETLLVDSAGKVVHTHPGKYDSAAQLRGDISKYLRVRLAG